jgi:hypothetical protein
MILALVYRQDVGRFPLLARLLPDDQDQVYQCFFCELLIEPRLIDFFWSTSLADKERHEFPQRGARGCVAIDMQDCIAKVHPYLDELQSYQVDGLVLEKWDIVCIAEDP